MMKDTEDESAHIVILRQCRDKLVRLDAARTKKVVVAYEVMCADRAYGESPKSVTYSAIPPDMSLGVLVPTYILFGCASHLFSTETNNLPSDSNRKNYFQKFDRSLE